MNKMCVKIKIFKIQVLLLLSYECANEEEERGWMRCDDRLSLAAA